MANEKDTKQRLASRVIYYTMTEKMDKVKSVLEEEEADEEFITSIVEMLETGIKNATTKAERAERELDLFTQVLDIIDEFHTVESLEEIRDMVEEDANDE